MNVVDFGNWVVLIIYVLVVYKSVLNFFNLHHAKLNGLAQTIAHAFCFTLLLQAGSFIALQIEWILEDNNTNVTDVASWGWMFYDYFNGFALLSFATLMQIYINWYSPKSNFEDRRKPEEW